MISSPITCWTEQDLPPYSIFWMRDILNPCALKAPIVRVYRPTPDQVIEEDFYDGTLVRRWSSVYGYYVDATYVGNTRSDALTNGGSPIPAMSQFLGWQLHCGRFWLGYTTDDVPDPTIRRFGVRLSTGYLIPATPTEDTDIVRGVTFIRLGEPDTVQRCVPVIMEYQNDWAA